MFNHDVTFNFDADKVCSQAIFETYFSYHKDACIWIAIIYYYIYFYLIVLFLLTVLLHFINVTAS